MIAFIKSETDLQCHKLDQTLPRDGRRDWREERRITKGQEKVLWGDGYIHCLDCYDRVIVVYISQIVKLYTLNMCSLCQLQLTK